MLSKCQFTPFLSGTQVSLPREIIAIPVCQELCHVRKSEKMAEKMIVQIFFRPTNAQETLSTEGKARCSPLLTSRRYTSDNSRSNQSASGNCFLNNVLFPV